MGENGSRRVEPTGDWEQIELLCNRPEQRAYELIPPLVLFGSPAQERRRDSGGVPCRQV